MRTPFYIEQPFNNTACNALVNPRAALRVAAAAASLFAAVFCLA
jgi:hypothetical protein